MYSSLYSILQFSLSLHSSVRISSYGYASRFETQYSVFISAEGGAASSPLSLLASRQTVPRYTEIPKQTLKLQLELCCISEKLYRISLLRPNASQRCYLTRYSAKMLRSSFPRRSLSRYVQSTDDLTRGLCVTWTVSDADDQVSGIGAYSMAFSVVRNGMQGEQIHHYTET